MNAPEQIIDRTQYIGSSDAASILGVSKWRTPLDTYKIKVGEETEKPDPAKEKVFKRGKRAEPLAIQALIEDWGVKVTKTSPPHARNYYTDPEHSFLRAEVDFEFEVTQALLDATPPGFIPPELLGTIQNGEVKSVEPMILMRDRDQPMWGEEFTEDIPIDYAAQSSHGLMVTDRRFCLYAVLVGFDLVLYKLERDDEIVAGMRGQLVRFWFDNVLPRVPPDPKTLSDVKYLLRKVRGRPCELDEATYKALTDLKILRDTIKANEAAEIQLQFEVAKYLCDQWALPAPELSSVQGQATILMEAKENAELRYGDRVIATYNSQRGAHLDQKQLKADKPEITAAYTVDHHFRVMRFKKV